MLTRRRVVAAKVETTEGTGVALAAADGGILAIDPKFEADITMHPRPQIGASMSPYADLPGGRMAKMSFGVELIGAGTAYSASNVPEVGKYLRACGFSETVVITGGAETVTYAPLSTGMPALSIGLYEDGLYKRMVGARGNVKFSSKVGEAVIANFEFTGVLDTITDVALIVPTYEDTLPSVLLAATFTVGGYAAFIQGFDIDMGNAVQLREDINKAAGFISAQLTGRRPTGKIDPEAVLVATHDWYGKWLAGTLGVLTIGPLGSTQYKKVKLSAPAAQYTKIADADRGGIAIADTSFLLTRSAAAGEDELSILFD